MINLTRNNNFDFLRFIAATLVILSHSYALTSADSQELLVKLTKGQWTFGGLAVATFFMISGFLVSHSFLNSKTFSEFALKRVLRIFPGLAVAIIVSAFIMGPLVTTLPLGTYLSHPQTYQYLHTIVLFPIEYVLPGVFADTSYPNAVNGSIWTIPYECICYALIGLLSLFGFFAKKERLIALFVLVFSLFLALPQTVLNHTKDGIILGYMLELFSYFLIGAIFYFFHNKIRYNVLYFILSILVLIYCAYQGEFKNVFIMAGAYIIFYVAFQEKIKLYWFGKYGDFSYGLYIYAFPVQQLVQHLTHNRLDYKGNFLMSFPITLVLAVLSWHFVEKYFVKKKGFFYEKLKNIQSIENGRTGEVQ